MHPSSYTVTIHVAHDAIVSALKAAGSSASPEDVVRELGEQKSLDITPALDAAIAHLNVHPDEIGPAPLFHIDSQPQGSFVRWIDGGEDMGPFDNDDEAVAAAIEAGGKHDEERPRWEPVEPLQNWHPAREDQPLDVNA